MSLGIYLHIPFCVSKCPYCDFYSTTGYSSDDLDGYTVALSTHIKAWGSRLNEVADTLYLGGGTPSLLGAKRIAALINITRSAFSMSDAAEITLEANPAEDLSAVFAAFAGAGGNRISIGMQAADNSLLHLLGRRHTAEQTERTVLAAHAAGIRNVSLDLMLGVAEQTESHVRHAVACCSQWGATHVSAYLLKIESGTPYASSLPGTLPNEDETVALYYTAAEELEKHGFLQYEISNFSKAGFESRHNLKYWECEPYLGIGPAAHSFLNGKRFYYPRSLSSFLKGEAPLPENPDNTDIAENSPEEFAMLRLRLTKGLTDHDFRLRFGNPLPRLWRERAAAMPRSLVVADDNGIRLTRAGFLVSDAILARLL